MKQKPKTKIHDEVYYPKGFETWFMYEIDHKDVIGHMGQIIPMDEL
jgi:hypothetical protein